MHYKNGYYICITDEVYTGIGECSYIENLSPDPIDVYEYKLKEVCECITQSSILPELKEFPSIQFGAEMALRDFSNQGRKILYESAFTEGEIGIPINGLIWMGTKEKMYQEIKQRLEQDYRCLKLKVGALSFEDELYLIKYIRSQFSAEILELRLDANGAFVYSDVVEKLKLLSAYNIHSIEQPIKPGQNEAMQHLCELQIIPIALDEELIQLSLSGKHQVVKTINPQYIILKPSLIGGIESAEKWIQLAAAYNIKWWATSALESNIGLNAIAQWVATTGNKLVQGLGTGSLYTNNVSSPLYIHKANLYYSKFLNWGNI